MKALLALVFFAVAANAETGTVHWKYEGHEGPEYWGKLSPEFATCGTGKAQSPIDVSKTEKAAPADKLGIFYVPTGLKILNNGHTVQVSVDPGSTITIGFRIYQLVQLHFHTPSENTVQKTSFPMEVHFVHKDPQGKLAVVGVLFKEGKENAELARIWEKIPTDIGKELAFPNIKIDLNKLLPRSKAYYHWTGSLTTPPCSEGVEWYLLKQPLVVTKDQADKFMRIIGKNARPVQPVNERVVQDVDGG